MTSARLRLKQKLYLSPLRGVVRRMGLRPAMDLLGGVRSFLWSLRYRWRRPDAVTVRIRDLTATFPVSSASEMRQAQTVGGERKLLDALVGKLKPGDVAYDVGANVGIFTAFLAKAVGETGQVIGFEPEESSRQHCEENLRRNSLRNVRLFPVALGDRDTDCELVACGGAGSGAHHVVHGHEGPAGAPRQRVRMAAGDHFIAAQGLPIPNLLKIDVEGMEMEVLSGLSQTLRRSECRAVCCEVHFSLLQQRGEQDAPRRIIRFLGEAGFTAIEWFNSDHCLAFK